MPKLSVLLPFFHQLRSSSVIFCRKKFFFWLLKFLDKKVTFAFDTLPVVILERLDHLRVEAETGRMKRLGALEAGDELFHVIGPVGCH